MKTLKKAAEIATRFIQKHDRTFIWRDSIFIPQKVASLPLHKNSKLRFHVFFHNWIKIEFRDLTWIMYSGFCGHLSVPHGDKS